TTAEPEAGGSLTHRRRRLRMTPGPPHRAGSVSEEVLRSRSRLGSSPRKTAMPSPFVMLGCRSAVAVLGLCVALGGSARAAAADNPKEERDIFNYEAQKQAKGVKKIVFVADTAPHGPRGNHEFLAAAIYLARTINANYPDAWCVVHTMKKWPKDLKHADAVVVLLNHGGSAVNPAVKEAMQRGAGF